MVARRLRRGARRALLPLLALFFVLSALPGPGRLADRRNWRTPTVERQFVEWSRTLSALGVPVTAAELEALSWRALTRYLAVRNALVAPLESVQSVFGLGQAWAMFTTPQTDPGRLVVEVQTQDGWHTVYTRGSDEPGLLAPKLEHHRMRKFIGRLSRTEASAPRRALADWLAREVATLAPDARSVRVSCFRWQTPPPGSNHERADLVSVRGGKPAWSLVRPVKRGP